MRRFHEARGWLATCGIAIVLFTIDVLADPQVSVIALYAALIVASVRRANPRALKLIGTTSGVLTILGHIIGPQPSGGIGIVNCFFDTVAITTITFLTLRIEAADHALREMQANLAHVSRLLLVEEMNTALAHELNQPLGAAAANAHAALRWFTTTPPNLGETQCALHRVIEAIEYAGTIVHQRRDLVRETPSPSLPVDVSQVIAEALKLLEHQFRTHKVHLYVESPDGLVVCGDGVRLRQVVINLASNAVEAMAEIPRTKVLQVSASRMRNMVQISLTDVGRGVEPAFEDHLFEPFRSTKPSGLGMGLAISRSIVRGYGGDIRAAPNLPHGMVLTVSIPALATDA